MKLINSLSNASVFKTAILFAHSPLPKPIPYKTRLAADVILTAKKYNGKRRYSAV